MNRASQRPEPGIKRPPIREYRSPYGNPYSAVGAIKLPAMMVMMLLPMTGSLFQLVTSKYARPLQSQNSPALNEAHDRVVDDLGFARGHEPLGGLHR
jgi:hypothetical protein